MRRVETPAAPDSRARPPRAAAHFVAFAVGFLVAGLGAAAAYARFEQGSPGAARSTREIADGALPATVVVRCDQQEGAGFFLQRDLVITNAHVLCGPTRQPKVELHDGRRLDAVVVHEDEGLDIAALKVRGANVEPIAVGDASTLRAGDTILAVGSPHGMAFSLSRGMISHNARVLFGLSLLQVDASINPGNSGGPLLDEQGRAVGVVSMRMRDADGLGLALPINYLYVGERALFRPPAVADSKGWASVVERAKREAQQEVGRMRQALQQGVLAAAAWQGDSLLQAVVMRQRAELGAALHFAIEVDGKSLFELSAEPQGWMRLEQADAPVPGSRMGRWLMRSGVFDGTMVGEVSLDCSESCVRAARRTGAVLRLREAAKEHDSVPIGGL